MHTVSHSTVSSTTDYRDSLSLIALSKVSWRRQRWPRGGERRADAVCDPPRERLVNDANERPYTTRTTAKVKSARRPTMLKILIPHVRTRPSMERRGGRDSGKSVNGAMFGVVAREHEKFGPNRAEHPNRAGLLRLRRCLYRRRP